jgi:hypothetical protein
MIILAFFNVSATAEDIPNSHFLSQTRVCRNGFAVVPLPSLPVRPISLFPRCIIAKPAMHLP